jgi:hypothetical protein
LVYSAQNVGQRRDNWYARKQIHKGALGVLELFPQSLWQLPKVLSFQWTNGRDGGGGGGGENGVDGVVVEEFYR